jgi:hypothetical protein
MAKKWRGPQTASDPLLTAAGHRRNKEHWRRLRLPCAVCGRAIDYDGPRYIQGRQNPRSLVVGHVVSRYTAKRAGWTEQQINSLSNSQPECQACSNRSGAQLGARVSNAKAKAKIKTGRSDRDRW